MNFFSMKKAVSLINEIDIGRFPRLLTRILQKLHLKLETVGWQLNLQMAHSAEAKLKSPQAVLQLGVSNEDSKSLQKVLVEFSHKELFDFYNKGKGTYQACKDLSLRIFHVSF
uniref:COMM domain-containing protein n=1 Tax=Capra hircus TaxID=9925 RepID=A0A8C2NQA6_CAPHI